VDAIQVWALLTSTIEQGLLFGFLGLGVLLTFRFFRFPDLTAEGSYPLGGAVAATWIVAGLDPILATIAALAAGALAGLATAIVHTKLRINNIVSGIVVMTALYSVNLRIMGRANVPLLGQPTVFTAADLGGGGAGSMAPGRNIALLLVLVAAVCAALEWFLRTDIGLAIRATGENEPMIRGLGVNTHTTKILGLALSNALIALSGALVAQNHGFADIGMGIGVLVTGAAAVLIGEAMLGEGTVVRRIAAAVAGVMVYRLLVAVALQAGMRPTDLRLVTAVLVLAALAAPRLGRRGTVGLAV
jgi:putative ABC transport system permease protein